MTRENRCPNPAAKNDATGWTASGSTTVTRVTDFPTPAGPRSTGVRTTGSGFVVTPVAACAPGETFTVSFYAYNDTGIHQFNHTIYISYKRSGGGDTFPETFQFQYGDDQVVSRPSFTTDQSKAPADVTGIYLVIDSLVADFVFTGALIEPVGALDSYADGDTSGWEWVGTNGSSASQESAAPTGLVVSVWDGATEVPAGVTVWDGATELAATVAEIAT